MIDGLIRWSLRHRTIVVALAAAFLVWGGWTATRIPLDVLPDLTAPTVTILAEAPGMDPLEIESLVTFPIESALNGAAGVRRVRSATAVGVAVVWVEFDWGQDINRARQTVTEKLTLVSGSLPPNVEPPFLAPVSSIMGEVLFIDLESDRHSPLELRTIAETVVRRRLLAVPGVSQVIATGGEQKQYEVVLDPARLAAHQVTLEEVETALTKANQNATAGFQVAQGQEYLVRGIGRLGDVDDIAAVSVKTTDAVPVLVRDIGIVREGAAIKRGEGSHNAKPAVIVGIQKQPAVNTLELTERIDGTLDDIQRALPQGMQIHRDLFRQADFIEQSLDNLFTALLEGAALVILVVVVFLMNMRAAVITLLALPLSLVAAVIAMDRFGLTINSMSLGGLAIAIGELVDDAIIDVENVVRRLRENAKRLESERVPVLEVVYRASTEIRHSVVFATVIVALVFLPLFMLSSVEGRLLRPLGFAYVVALTASLVVALTVTPVLCSWLLPQLSIDRVRNGTASDAAPQGGVRALARACIHVLADRAGGSGGPADCGGRRHTRRRPVIPSRVQRRCADRQRGDRSGHEPRRLERAWECTRAADAQRPGGHVDRTPNGTRRAGRARARRGIGRNRRPPRDERAPARRGARGAETEGLAAPGHERDHRPADLSPHRPHALGDAREHRRQSVRRRSPDAPAARAARCQGRWRKSPGVVDLATEQQTDIPTLKVRVDAAAAARHGLAKPGPWRKHCRPRVSAMRSVRSCRDRSRSPWSCATRSRIPRHSIQSRRRRSRRRTGARFRCRRLRPFRKIADPTS